MNLLLERRNGCMRLKHGDSSQIGDRKIKLDHTTGAIKCNFGAGPGFPYYSAEDLEYALIPEIGQMSRVGIPFPTRFMVDFYEGDGNPGPWNMHDAVDFREMLEIHGVFSELNDVHPHFATVVSSSVNRFPAIYPGLLGKAVKNPTRLCSAW